VSGYKLALQDQEREEAELVKTIQKVHDDMMDAAYRDKLREKMDRMGGEIAPRELELARGIGQSILAYDMAISRLLGLRREVLETQNRLKGVLRKNLSEDRMRSLVDEYAVAIQHQHIEVTRAVQDLNTVYDNLRADLGLPPDGKEGRRFSQEVVQGSEEGSQEGKYESKG
jgi:hypothetical protein